MHACRHMPAASSSDSVLARRLVGPVSDKEPLQVRIPVAVKRRFKAHAALRGLEPNELFVELWERYEASLGNGESRTP